jgi:hypothetical protein
MMDTEDEPMQIQRASALYANKVDTLARMPAYKWGEISLALPQSLQQILASLPKVYLGYAG